jgi:2-(1,2-epoxy-1,2-dihydrophenyl)acetyl-CoA isomerase
MAPSSRIVSPLSMALSMTCRAVLAYSSGRPRRLGCGIGLVPDAGASWLLPRAVGSARAAEMALLGRAVGAAEARDWGLVNEVTPDAEVRERALELAHGIAGLSSSVGTTRRLLGQAFGADLAGQLDAEASAQGRAQHEPGLSGGPEGLRGEAQAPLQACVTAGVCNGGDA